MNLGGWGNYPRAEVALSHARGAAAGDREQQVAAAPWPAQAPAMWWW